MKATAVANANIALVKYWGKRDSKLILPYQSSLSMNCQGLWAKTTVEFGNYPKDEIIINDKELKNDEKDFLGQLERIRGMAGIKDKARVQVEFNFPVAAGLASSAAGISSGTMAAVKAAGLELEEKELTILTRIGSGSACRSIPEGFVEWHKGVRPDGSDSIAESLVGKDHWPGFRIIACILTEERKPVSSRAGMAQTVETCPYYPAWVESAAKDLIVIRAGILEWDFQEVGKAAELNCLKMHATMMTTNPPIIYWIPETLKVIHAVRSFREEGLEAYFTIDGGPQVKVMCMEENAQEIGKRLKEIGVNKAIACSPGEGARLVREHLF